MVGNKELNGKDIEIATLNFELRSNKEVIEFLKKPSEAMKHFEYLMKSSKGINDTTRLGYNSTTKKGESSKSGEQKNAKGKPTCH